MRIGGVSEVAELLGVSRQRVAKLRAREDFPDPLGEIALGPVWNLDDVEAWSNSESRATPGRPLNSTVERTLGGRFVLEEPRIGRGGFADVFRAIDRKQIDQVPRPVAVKVLHKIESRAIKRWQRELRIVAKLKHPRVIPILGEGTTSTGSIWYAMPLAQGSLVQFAEEIEGNLAALFDVIRQVCAGLEFIHQQKVYHRDLKPGNILRFGNNAWVIADFGLAVEAERMTTTLTATQQGLGTPWYASPEQLAGAREVDQRSDIFSLGRILQELITGERSAVISPGPLRGVIQKATANSPSDRHQAVCEFLADLERSIDALTHGQLETPEEAAGRLLPRVRQTRAAEGDLDDFVRWALSLNEDVETDMAALARILPWLSTSSIRYIWKSNAHAFREIFMHHCSHVAHSTFKSDFAICDVIADFARRAVNETRDPLVVRHAIRSLTILGSNHHRWHVRDVVVSILQRVRNSEAVLNVIDGLQDAGKVAVEWTISDFSLRSLPPLLRSEIEKLVTGRVG